MGQVAALNARLAVVEGRTRLMESHSTAPLKLLRPFPQLDGGVEICVMDASPGLLEGDNYSLNWHLETGACARITTQGFARIHPCFSQPATISTRITLEPAAHLIYVPEATLPFAQARLNASTQVELKQGAKLILLESFCAGRTARQESWHFSGLQSRLTVADEKGVLASQQLKLCPSRSNPISPANWGSCTHSAQLWAFSPGIAAFTLQESLAVLERVNGNVRCHGSTLARDGLCVLLAGHRAWDVREAAHQIIAGWQTMFEMFHVKHDLE